MYECQRSIAKLNMHTYAIPPLEQRSSATLWGLKQCVKCCDSFLGVKCWHNSMSDCQMRTHETATMIQFLFLFLFLNLKGNASKCVIVLMEKKPAIFNSSLCQ